ncbi:MAG: tetraacyldisaccharide 4'-kinase, partial [Rickettsiales bacterium]|nr:tetraacyldisaccharide 4'-kinase [Rickettsiales bacterium]
MPKFWKSKNFSIYSAALFPLSLLYYLAYRIRCLVNIRPYKSQIPVVCVGNVTAGGSGKTPMAIEIAKILRDNGKTYCFLSRGYGGKIRGVAKLNAANISPYIVGDEAPLLYDYGDTFVSTKKAEGLKYINKYHKYDYIIVDDGIQNPTFFKDRTILMVYGEFGFGNGLMLPAGPLRETFSSVCSRHLDLVVIVGEDSHSI